MNKWHFLFFFFSNRLKLSFLMVDPWGCWPDVFKDVCISPQVKIRELKFVKEGEKCWCISRNGLSSPQHIRSLTSPALPLRTKMSKSKSSRLQKRKEGFWSHEWRSKEMARWRENDRGPDKMVEGPSSKGDRIAIAFSKKGQPISTL